MSGTYLVEVKTSDPSAANIRYMVDASGPVDAVRRVQALYFETTKLTASNAIKLAAEGIPHLVEESAVLSRLSATLL